MIIPLRTDAPVYHRPWATGGIIAVNVAVQIWASGADESQIEPFMLRFGEWAPWQWLTSVFLHAGWIHLVGNMLFLWVFGLVVEGKIGWWRFLALYGAIAVAANLVEQTVMLGGVGGSLGASGVIYGLIGVAMVWAPENEVECLFCVIPWVRRFDISIKNLGLLYLGLEVLGAVLGGFRISSAVLHLIGAAAGIPIGVAMLRRGWVDCEGWDWFSRRDYRPVPIRLAPKRAKGPAPGAPRAAAAPVRAVSTAPADAVEVPAESAARRFSALVTDGDAGGALRLHEACSAAERSTLDLSERLQLARALVAADLPADARTVASGVLHDDPSHPGAGLLEAEQLLRERRPSKAARLLTAIAERVEGAAERDAHAALLARAEELRAAGVLEWEE